MKTLITTIFIILFFIPQNSFAQGVIISPTNTSIVNPNALLELESVSKGLLISRMTETQKLAIFPTPTPTSEGLLIYQTDGISGFYYYSGSTWQQVNDNIVSGNAPGDIQYWDGNQWVSLPAGANNTHLVMCGGAPEWLPPGGNCVAAVGNYSYGGIVFYFFQSGDPGYVPGEQHGLVCAPTDLGTGSKWGCFGSIVTGANGIAIGTGTQNTIDIVSSCTNPGTAAGLCSNLNLNGYSDWFLPSRDELNQMYLNKTFIDSAALANNGGSFSNGLYWSSTENFGNFAWSLNFSTGVLYSVLKKNYARVRAIRAF